MSLQYSNSTNKLNFLSGEIKLKRSLVEKMEWLLLRKKMLRRLPDGGVTLKGGGLC